MYSVNLYIFFWHVACVPLKHTKYRSWEYFFCASDLGAQQISPLASLLLWFSAWNRISQGPSFNGDVRMWRVGGLMSCVHLRWSLGLTMSWIMHGPCSDKKQTCTNDHMSEYMSYAAMLITLSEKPSMHLVDCSSLSQASAHLEMCQQSSSDGRARHPQTSSQRVFCKIDQDISKRQVHKIHKNPAISRQMSSKWLTKRFSHCNNMKQTGTRITEMDEAAAAKTAKAVQRSDLFLDLGFRLFIQFHRLALFVLKLVLRAGCHAHHTYIR